MFDPTLPLANSEMRSDEMRNQFNGLKDLIDAIPSGSAGDPEAVVQLRKDAFNVFSAAIVKNTLGGTLTVAKESTGQYLLTCTGAFPGTATLVLDSPVWINAFGTPSVRFWRLSRVDDDNVRVYSLDDSGNPVNEDVVNGTSRVTFRVIAP